MANVELMKSDWEALRSEGYGLAECVRTLAALHSDLGRTGYKVAQQVITGVAAQTIYIQWCKSIDQLKADGEL